MVMHRVEIRSCAEVGDPKASAAMTSVHALELGSKVSNIEVADVYLIEGDLSQDAITQVTSQLLAHPLTDEALVGVSPPRSDAMIEIHPLPGVMDPAAEAVEAAIQTMLNAPVKVRTGIRYDIHGVDRETAADIASQCLANPLIHEVCLQASFPDSFPAAHDHDMRVREVRLSNLSDDELAQLSREAHLFLSLDEMRAVAAHFRQLGREPREIELETLAQTWSEHCVHKTLKSIVEYEGTLPEGAPIPNATRLPNGNLRIENLLASTVAAATNTLMEQGLDEWCLSVFVDNAGIVGFDDDHAVCFKVETHNHPSALEPYGGAATGIGGCIRDVLGTGLAARPIAATDVFCVAPLDTQHVPSGCLHPQRILTRVVDGVRDYGNRMGIPTLNGAVWFDQGHVGNPLVFCGCLGVMPRDRVRGEPQPGDRIVALGGRTGRDGIHGATFSSAELTDTHADEFSHAVQIGAPITEKKVLDAIIEARDHEQGCLYSAITDCGAGGFSSAIGEMGETLGAEVHLENAPLKYPGLTPTEIWISEAQERMVLAVPASNLEDLAQVCEAHEVEWCDLGCFGTPSRELILHYSGEEIGRLGMAFLHDGIPSRVRQASWSAPSVAINEASQDVDIEQTLLSLLSHPNIASKQDIVAQYDHEVQGRTMLKPFVGVHGDGPGDAAVITPVRGSTRALAIANGLATGWCADPYLMVLAAIDECVRNLVCVGADPSQIAILDNYCWPGCDDPQRMAELVRASVACYHGGLAYRTPFISGKDSLNNQFTPDAGETIRIPPTMLISGLGIVPDLARCVTMDAKRSGHALLLVGQTESDLGGSHLIQVSNVGGSHALPVTDLEAGPDRARRVAHVIGQGLVHAAHDCSEGGLLAAVSEMAMAGGLGIHLDESAIAGSVGITAGCFAETPSRYLLEVAASDVTNVQAQLEGHLVTQVGIFQDSSVVQLGDLQCDVEMLRNAWRNGVRL